MGTRNSKISRRDSRARRFLVLILLISSAALGGALPAVGQTTESIGWRLSDATTPGGTRTVTIMRTADPTRSDIEIAGLMFRCADGALDALFVLLAPLAPASQPKVSIDLGGVRLDSDLSVLPSGAGLLLPRETLTLFEANPGIAADLSFTITADGKSYSARIPNLRAPSALARLRQECLRP